MPNDSVGAKDSVGATINAVAAPRHPCPNCGKETKEQNPLKVFETDETGVRRLKSVTYRRICSNRSCRHVLTIQPN